jgi:hypothetical protein
MPRNIEKKLLLYHQSILPLVLTTQPITTETTIFSL